MKKLLTAVLFAASILTPQIFAQSIKATDRPDGFASVNAKSQFGGNPEKSVTVKTGADLKKYASEGGYVIYIDGMIDITDGKMPKTAFDDNPELGKFISENTNGTIKSWSQWRNSFAKCMNKNTDYAGNGRHKNVDETMDKYFQALYNAWKPEIMVNVQSNTTIIGLNGNSGLKGASLQLVSVENIAIRNLNLQDAMDPFPHHEDKDGFNAQYDCINISESSNIWIDHVTFQDTISVGLKNFAHVKLGDGTDEKWQTTDGFLDMSKNFHNITISYCHFYNHDKTCLWGSSDSEKLSVERTVTAHHNYFHNCVQRLPMIRLANAHLYNNYFDVEGSSAFTSAYAIGARYNSFINSEKNYFGSGIKYSIQGDSKKPGNVYSNGDKDSSSAGKRTDQYKSSNKPVFEIPYEYTLDDNKKLNKELPAKVGAGVLKVDL